MGAKVNTENLAFIFFKPINDQFRGFLTFEAAFTTERNPEVVIKEATKIYERSIRKMTSIMADIKAARLYRKLVAARKVWGVGDAIFSLKDELEELGLQIDGVYDHLTRDLNLKRKWLEKVIILRRYLSNVELIPESLNWGRLEKGTRRKAEKLKLGLPIS